MDEKWEYYVSTVIADESDRVKTAEKLEAMMKRQGVAGWELVNVVPFGTNSLYAIYKRPLSQKPKQTECVTLGVWFYI